MTGPFGELLRGHRRALGLTQDELAERALISGQAVGALERGDRRFPRRDTVTRLADALELAGKPRADFVAAAPKRRAPQFSLTDQEIVSTPRPRELPPDTYGFVGREQQLDELDQIFERSSIATVCGTAGVGKTALAVHWAHTRSDRFPDGQLYVNLRGYDPNTPMVPTDVLAMFLRSLSGLAAEVPQGLAERVKRYRTLLADRRMLILLDNAHSVDQVLDLVPGTTKSLVVITSRETLAGLSVRHGAHRINVDPLPVPDAEELMRIHLGDRLDTESRPAVLTLIDQCARLPLALRIAAQLAAARPTSTVGELVSELNDEQQRLELLDAGDPHSSAQTVFSWSYRHLPEPAARLFHLLGVYPGQHVDRYAAAALMGIDPRQARHLIATLHRAHLIHETASGRYGMHDLLSAYAALQTREHDDSIHQAALTRLFDYYLQAAANAMDRYAPYDRHLRPAIADLTPHVPELPDQVSALTWLDTERPNLVAAGVHAADHGWSTHTRRLSAIVHRYLSVGAHYDDARILHGAALRTADTTSRGRALVRYGVALWRSGHHQEALTHYQRALDIHRETGDRQGEALVLINCGNLYRWLGSYSDSLKQLRRALAITREVHDRWCEARTLDALGLLYRALGDYPEAEDHQQRAIDLYRQTGDTSSEAGIYGNLGLTCSQLGRETESLDYHNRALATLHKLGDRRGQAEALNDMGTSLITLARPQKAIECHLEALALAETICDQHEQARAHDGLAQCHYTLRHPRRAQKHWQAALTLYTKLGIHQANQIAIKLQGLKTHHSMGDSP